MLELGYYPSISYSFCTRLSNEHGQSGDHLVYSSNA